MSGIADFLSRRKQFTNEYFACPGSRKTVLVSSHTESTDLMAHALLKLGFNVLVAEPWFLFWLDDRQFANFDNQFNQWVKTLKKFNVQLVLGGNTTVMVPHPRTKELLHRAAGVPAVHYWWHEPRAMPPMTRRGLTAYDYLRALRDSRTLNVFWDVDVYEEVRRFLGVDNAIHAPLGTTPDLWQTAFVPLERRPTKLCFLGNNDEENDVEAAADPLVVQWAHRVVDVRLANPDKPMADCIETVGGPGEQRGTTARRPYELAANLKEEFGRWNVLAAVLLRRIRNVAMKAAAEHLGDEFRLVGKGWDRLGLRARQDHGGVPGAKDLYASARASLNLFGGCVHGGLPLRPYEIASSNGLIFSQYNRELPSLFEPDTECIAFRNVEGMRESLDRILANPAAYNQLVEAGRKRAIAHHTWEHRLRRVMDAAKERFGLPW